MPWILYENDENENENENEDMATKNQILKRNWVRTCENDF